MSGVKFRAVTGQVSCVTATPKTVMQLIAATNQRVTEVYFTVSFEGIAPTDAPAQVRILKQTSAGTMTSLTPVKDAADPETLQTTAQHSASAEPTASDVKYSQFVHPQGAAREIGPFVLPAGERIGIEVTASATVDCIVSARGVE